LQTVEQSRLAVENVSTAFFGLVTTIDATPR